jgi:SAM-dependent methyltransferase
MSTFGRDVASLPYWEAEAANYRVNIDANRTAYHRNRFLTADRLLDRASLPSGARIVDFGCGDGAYAHELASRGYRVTGLDPAQAMVELAGERRSGAEFLVGGAGDLAQAGECDAVIALNVLAYMTDAEMDAFWSGLAMILARGGSFLVSHSNELFDMFALNAGTATFFARNFTAGVAVDHLLAQHNSDHPGYNVRSNPLTYAGELSEHGLKEVAQAFFNYHPLPPKLLGDGDEGRIVDVADLEAVPVWRQMFQCSTMFSLSQRLDSEPSPG